jgi:hypothetical protein
VQNLVFTVFSIIPMGEKVKKHRENKTPDDRKESGSWGVIKVKID